MADIARQRAHRSAHNPTFVNAPDALTPLESAALLVDDAMALALATTAGTASAEALFGRGDTAAPSHSAPASASAASVPLPSPVAVPLVDSATVTFAEPKSALETRLVPTIPLFSPEELAAMQKQKEKDEKRAKKAARKEAKHAKAEKKKQEQATKKAAEPVAAPPAPAPSVSDKAAAPAAEKPAVATDDSKSKKNAKNGKDTHINDKEVERLKAEAARVKDLLVPSSRLKKEKRRHRKELKALTDVMGAESARREAGAHSSVDKAHVAATYAANQAAAEKYTKRGTKKRAVARKLGASLAYWTQMERFNDVAGDKVKAKEMKRMKKRNKKRAKRRAKGEADVSSDEAWDSDVDEVEEEDDTGRVVRHKKKKDKGGDESNDDVYRKELGDLIVADGPDQGDESFEAGSSADRSSSDDDADEKSKDDDDDDDSDNSDDDNDDAGSDDDKDGASSSSSGAEKKKKLKEEKRLAREAVKEAAKAAEAAERLKMRVFAKTALASSESSSSDSSSSDDDEAKSTPSNQSPNDAMEGVEHTTPNAMEAMLLAEAAASAPVLVPDPLLTALAQDMDMDTGTDDAPVNFAATTFGKIAEKVPSTFARRIMPTMEQAAKLANPESALLASIYHLKKEEDVYNADCRSTALAIGYGTYRLAPPLAGHLDKAFAIARARALGLQAPTLPSNVTQRTFVSVVADALGTGAPETLKVVASVRDAAARVDTPLRRLTRSLANARHVQLLNRMPLPDEDDGRFFCPLAGRAIRKGERVDVYRIIERGPWEDAPWSGPRPWESAAMQPFVTVVLLLAFHTVGAPVPLASAKPDAPRPASDVKRKELASTVAAAPEEKAKKARKEVPVLPPPAQTPNEVVNLVLHGLAQMPLQDYEVEMRPMRDTPYEGTLVLKVNAFWRALDAERRAALGRSLSTPASDDLMGMFGDAPAAPVPTADPRIALAINTFAEAIKNVRDMPTLMAAVKACGMGNDEFRAMLVTVAQLVGKASEASQSAAADLLAQFTDMTPATALPRAAPEGTGFNQALLALSIFASQRAIKTAATVPVMADAVNSAEALARRFDPSNSLWSRHKPSILALFNAVFPLPPV